MAQLMVDASVFIRMERTGQQPTALSSMYPDDEFVIAAITVSELMVGVLRADSQRRRQQRQEFVDRIIRAVEVISFDLGAAVHHANTLVALLRSGQLIGVNDLLIASTALSHAFTLLTADLRSFPRVPGLSVQPFN